jgi:hypothetical protein
MVKLKAAVDYGTEDIQNVDRDVKRLAKKYIYVIDRLRSIKQGDSRPVESRANAFYRVLGMPVSTSDGEFYNPGFDPVYGEGEKKKLNINSKVNSSNFKQIMIDRESLHRDLSNIFLRQDIASSVYAIVLRHVRPFQILDVGKGPLDADKQSFVVDARADEAAEFAVDNPLLESSIDAVDPVFEKTPVGVLMSGGRHILRPFIVNPEVDAMPSNNIVCVPFLPSITDTRIYKQNDNKDFLYRPGLEMIIRLRLKNNIEDKSFLNNVKKILNSEVSPSEDPDNLDKNTIISTIVALSENNEVVEDEVFELFQGISSIQLVTVGRLIRTIKGVVQTLRDSVEIIDEAMDTINWIPVPHRDGPELGKAHGARFSTEGSSIATEIDRTIVELKIKSDEAKRVLQEQEALGKFASPFADNSGAVDVDKYDEEINRLSSKKKSIAYDALDAMGDIEIISGEISGLGLIDILAIYTALWAMEEEDLIGLLDDRAFNRLATNNKDLITDAVVARQNGLGVNVITALTRLEQLLINIFSFIDKELENKYKNQDESITGTL